MIVSRPEVILVNRIRHGLTKEQLAIRIGVAPSSVSRAEARKGISTKTAKAICDYFGIDPSELLEVGGENDGEERKYPKQE